MHAIDKPAQAAELSLRLGQRIRSARAARAMTMKQLANDADISLPYLSRVEKGDGNISIGVLYKLAQALSLDPDTLLADNEKYGNDYALIVELLKRQPAPRLARLRDDLIAELAEGETQATPKRIALTGLRGSGKSTIGPLLAEKLRLPFIELNREVEKVAGLSLGSLFSVYGQGGFRRFERQCLDQVIASHPELVLATGGGIVVEPSTYELLLHSFYTVWLHAEPEEYFRRVMAQHDARIATHQLEREAMTNIRDTMAERRKLYARAQLSIDTNQQSPEAIAEQIASEFIAQQQHDKEAAHESVAARG